MTRAPLSALIPILLALPAQAQDCPTAADLDTGIHFELTQGEAEEFRRYSDGRIASVFYQGGAPVTLLLLHKGLYLSEVTDIEDFELQYASRTTYRYDLDPADLPLPILDGSFSATTQVTENGDNFMETHQYRFGASEIATFGDCAYRMIPIEVRYVPDPDNAKDFLHWLPDLGVSLLVRAEYDDGADVYTYTGISKKLRGDFQ